MSANYDIYKRQYYASHIDVYKCQSISPNAIAFILNKSWCEMAQKQQLTFKG